MTQDAALRRPTGVKLELARRRNGPSQFSSGQVARMLGVSTQTVQRWARLGVLQSHRTLGGHLRFYPEDVDVAMRTRLQPKREELTAEDLAEPWGALTMR